MAASAGRNTRAANFPAVAVRDIVIHPRTSDLVLATHGRGIWIIDDISPLRALTPDLMSEDADVPAGAPGRAVDGDLRRLDGGRRYFHRAQPSRPTPSIPYYQRSRHILRRS